MKKFILSAFTLLLALTGSAADKPTFYAATLHGMNGTAGPAFITNDPSSDFAPAIVKGLIDPDDNTVTMRCGANCNGTYYGLLYKDQKPLRLATVDWQTGKATKVADLPADYPAFIDLAYNYKTNTLYGIVVKDGKTDVYEITDTKTGDNKKVATLDVNARAFEFSLDGTLYTLSSTAAEGEYMGDALLTTFDGNFKQLEQRNIGDPWSDKLQIYDYGTYNYHSLEFDYVNNLLYWTNTDSQQQYVYAIDVKTAKRQNESYMLDYDPNYMSNVDAVSLYIPFTMPDGGLNAALAVSDLTAKADNGGTNVDTLTWTNPSKTFGGDSLKELYSVRIYRGAVDADSLIEEVTEGVAAGEKMTWIDRQAKAGSNTYVVVPCRVKDEKGLSASVAVYVGFDTPLGVNNISLQRVDKGVKVKWEAPQGTEHGGVLDTATLKYDVLRLPDSVWVARDTEADSLIDENPFTAWDHYSYEVTPKTAAGAGQTGTGYANIYAGPDFTAPYETDFKDNDANGLWAKDNRNNDGFDGYFDSQAGMFTISAVYYTYDESVRPVKTLNTYLYSPDIKLAPGKYKVTVGSYIKSKDMTNKFTVRYGKGQNLEGQKTVLGNYEYKATQDEEKDTAVTETFEVTEEGKYNFSVNLTGPKLENDYEHSTVGICYFKVEKVEEQARVFNLTGTVKDDQGKAVEGAGVVLTFGEETAKAITDAEGRFAISDIKADPEATYTVQVSKAGYDDATSTFNYEDKDVELTVTLNVISGINGVHASTVSAGTRVYDLSGRLLKDVVKNADGTLRLKKGVYIVNGKKLMVR